MMLTVAGDQSAFNEIESSDEVLALTLENGTETNKGFLRWSGHLLIPLVYDDQQNGKLLLGLCGFPGKMTAKWMLSIYNQSIC